MCVGNLSRTALLWVTVLPQTTGEIAKDTVDTVAVPAMQAFADRLKQSGHFPHNFAVGGVLPQADAAFACVCEGRAVGAAGPRLSNAPLASFKITASAKVENESVLRLEVSCEVGTLQTQAWTQLYRSSIPPLPVALGHKSIRDSYREELGRCYDKCVQFYQKLKAAH